MKKLLKSLACISLVFLLSANIVSAKDNSGGGGMWCGSCSTIIEEIVIK